MGMVTVTEQSKESEPNGDVVALARAEFRTALIESQRTHSSIGEVEAAAARFCRALKAEGKTPERTLIDAKEVIHDAIDGSDGATAERAILSCIQHYFRD